jgi:hypothetical protein
MKRKQDKMKQNKTKQNKAKNEKQLINLCVCLYQLE